VFLGSFGINDSDQCLVLLNTLMTYLAANSDVFTGWTWWAAGPWWANDYVYLLEPNADGSDPNRLMATLQQYFPPR
jgi:endoglucanase